VTRLPRILSSLLLLAGALAWLLGPGAPAQSRGAAAESAGDPAVEDPPPVEIWLEDHAASEIETPASPAPEAPTPRTLAAERSEPEPPVPDAPEPDEATESDEPPESGESEWSESAPGDARRAEAPAPPDADAALDLVRRLLALQARMRGE
jgi:outer membrane biosynthesis protein TonB